MINSAVLAWRPWTCHRHCCWPCHPRCTQCPVPHDLPCTGLTKPLQVVPSRCGHIPTAASQAWALEQAILPAMSCRTTCTCGVGTFCASPSSPSPSPSPQIDPHPSLAPSDWPSDRASLGPGPPPKTMARRSSRAGLSLARPYLLDCLLPRLVWLLGNK